MKLVESIRQYARATAGRYFNNEQKRRICDLIGRATRLTGEEQSAFANYVFDGRFDRVRTLLDCKNAYVLAVTDGMDLDAEYLRAAVEGFSFAEGVWYDKEHWVAYANAKDRTFETVCEGAYFAYAVGDLDRARESFGELALANHLASIRIFVALLSERGESDLACEWLTVYKRIREELYRETLNPADQAALDAYLAEGRKEAYTAAYKRYVDYFDADSIGGMQFFAGGGNHYDQR